MLSEIGPILQFGALGLLGYMIWLFHTHIENEAKTQAELRQMMAEKIYNKLECLERALQRDRVAMISAIEAMQTYIAVANGNVSGPLKESVSERLRKAAEQLIAVQEPKHEGERKTESQK